MRYQRPTLVVLSGSATPEGWICWTGIGAAGGFNNACYPGSGPSFVPSCVSGPTASGSLCAPGNDPQGMNNSSCASGTSPVNVNFGDGACDAGTGPAETFGCTAGPSN